MEKTATVKLVYENKTRDGKERNPIKLRVLFNRDKRTYTTGSSAKITPEEWAKPNLKVTKQAIEESRKAEEVAIEICKDLGPDFTFDSFYDRYKKELFGERHAPNSLDDIFERYSTSHDISIGTKNAYKTAVNSVKLYKAKAKISDITTQLLTTLENKWQEEGKSINTIRIHMRSLRALYNYAVEENLVKDTQPFKKVKTTPIRSMNKGLDIKDFEKIVEYHNDRPVVQRARDFWLFRNFCGCPVLT